MADKTLDDRLDDILSDAYYAGTCDPEFMAGPIHDESIAEIKQAFQDARYIPLFQSGDKFHDDYEKARVKLEIQHKKDIADMTSGDRIMNKIDNLMTIFETQDAFRYGDKVFMTGAEWLSRFRKDLDLLPTYYDDQVEILKAAKRASGIV